MRRLFRFTGSFKPAAALFYLLIPNTPIVSKETAANGSAAPPFFFGRLSSFKGFAA